MLLTPENVAVLVAALVGVLAAISSWIKSNENKPPEVKHEPQTMTMQQSSALDDIADTLKEMLAIYRERR